MNARSIALLAVAACSSTPAPLGLSGRSTALDADQCDYFQSGGTVVVCHATTSAKNPVVKLQIATAACIDAHAAHPLDFAAVNGDCGPDACLPAGAPCDTTLRCCDPDSCGGGGVPGVCGCTPRTCADLGLVAGNFDDGCGGTLTCTCPAGMTATPEGNCLPTCSPTTNCGAGGECCQGADGMQLVWCPTATPGPQVIWRWCLAGQPSCSDGGKYPCLTGTAICPAGSSPTWEFVPSLKANASQCETSNCGPVGGKGCAICKSLSPTTSASLSWDGASCSYQL